MLHDAIAKDLTEIVELLVNFRGVDLSVKNKRGFNCLHHAALKGNARSVRILMNSDFREIYLKMLLYFVSRESVVYPFLLFLTGRHP